MHRMLTNTALLLLLPMLLVAGCGGPANTATVEGTITLDGDLLPGAMIEFKPDAPEGRTSYGQSDENGRYVMIYYGETPGAELGVNTVKITLPDPGDDGGEKKVIPAKYNTKSEEKRDVQPGKNTFDFQLASE